MSDDGRPDSGQAIKAIVSLVGGQDTAVAAHRPRTDGAAVSVRIGRTLIYMGDAETAVCFRRVWEAGRRDVRSIPVSGDSTRVRPVAGVAEPSLMLEASGSPPAIARLERGEGGAGTLWVTLGRITFDVRDHAAFLSTMNAFQRAERLAARTFLPTAPENGRTRAAHTAAQLFDPPAARRRQRPAVRPEQVAAAARPVGAAVRLPVQNALHGRAAR